jgi:hypothetical protein
MSTSQHDQKDDDLADTLDDESLAEWIARRTRASLTGNLTADDVAQLYTEETGQSADIITVVRVLAHLYTTSILNGELAFRAALPH